MSREHGGGSALFHTGPGCRVGAVELGLSLDSSHSTTSGTMVMPGAQLKWARQMTDTVGVGLLLSTLLEDRSVRIAGNSLVVPVTWQPAAALLVHLNLGRDFRRGVSDVAHAGNALEWAPGPAWSFIAERYRENAVSYWRVGGRYALNSEAHLDFSRAVGLGQAPSF